MQMEENNMKTKKTFSEILTDTTIKVGFYLLDVAVIGAFYQFIIREIIPTLPGLGYFDMLLIVFFVRGVINYKTPKLTE